MAPIGVGALTTGVLAEVDERGTVRASEWTVRWRVHVGDRWIDPTTEGASNVRSARPAAAPLAETAVRVPGGEMIQRAYGLGDDGGIVVVEVENASPNGFAVGFLVAGARADDVLAVGRKPGDVETDGTVVFPVPHRQSVRVALGNAGADVKAVADWETVTRAWERVLERGLRTELPDPLQWEIDAARADLLLAAPAVDAFIALEDWGFDDEAVAMWAHLGMRDRRRARRHVVTDPGVLANVRADVLRVTDDTIELVPGFRPAWLGQHLAVHDAPTRTGAVSFAVRWHGARPAVLWDVPAGLRVSAPALDRAWSSTEPAGETLLAEPPAQLLAMGPGRLDADGVAVDAPESFA